jgi:UDP-N-acetylglucosamine 2-epimerase (non-hydrolysing)
VTPEEIDRVVTDHIADYLLAPTESAQDLSLEEAIPDDRIYVVGNTIVDAVLAHRDLAVKRSTVLSDLDLTTGEFVRLSGRPINPRTRDRLNEFDLSIRDEI